MNTLFGKARSIVILAIVAFTLAMNYSFNKPATTISKMKDVNAQEFLNSVTALNIASGNFRNGSIGVEELRGVFADARKAYKKIEFLVEFYYPSFAEEHLNGAPLLHMERHDTRPYVVEPEGLQVLDEKIFSENALDEKVEISILCQRLLNETNVLMEGLHTLTIEPHDLVEAIRQELVRVLSLGITGFDTPGSLNAMEESAIAMEVLQEASEPFLLALDPERAKVINGLFTGAVQALYKEHDFDAFDRLTFLKNYIHPLYAEMQKVKQALDLPDSKSYSGLNPLASSIFSDDFLDPYSYTQLKRNEDSRELKELGEKLFYDPILSKDGKLSCASCHNPALAFSDGKIRSESNVVGETVLRNSPTLVNAVYADRYFYDLRAFTLEQQAEHVIFNQQEFNTAYQEIVAKLNASKAYRKLFGQALGKKQIDREGVSRALASFVLSLRSFNSPFDKYVRGETDTLNPEAIRGFNLFMGKAACGTCHFAPTFSGLVPPRYVKNESEILGVVKNPGAWAKELDDDLGRLDNQIYSEQAWIFERSFKTPTVRNVELTAPYFHNGAFSSLEAVVSFYDRGGGSGFGLDVKNQTLPTDPLNLSPDEKQALVAFMKSLTDTSFVH